MTVFIFFGWTFTVILLHYLRCLSEVFDACLYYSKLHTSVPFWFTSFNVYFCKDTYRDKKLHSDLLSEFHIQSRSGVLPRSSGAPQVPLSQFIYIPPCSDSDTVEKCVQIPIVFHLLLIEGGWSIIMSIKGQLVILSTPTDPQFVHGLSDHIPCRNGKSWNHTCNQMFGFMQFLDF